MKASSTCTRCGAAVVVEPAEYKQVKALFADAGRTCTHAENDDESIFGLAHDDATGVAGKRVELSLAMPTGITDVLPRTTHRRVLWRTVASPDDPIWVARVVSDQLALDEE